MYYNNQTLKHKKTNKLARLVPHSKSTWAWDIGERTPFIGEDGKEFLGNICDYTHIEDELGRPYSKQPKEGQFIDESAKKYLVNKYEKLKMRKKKLLEWEKKVLGVMKKGDTIIKGQVRKRGSVLCPFADGSQSTLFRRFFLKRRKAIPLYKYWNSIRKEYVNGPVSFTYKKEVWVYHSNLSELCLIKPGSTNAYKIFCKVGGENGA